MLASVGVDRKAPGTIDYGSIITFIDKLKAGGAGAIALGNEVKSP